MTEESTNVEAEVPKVTNFGIEDILSNKFGTDQIDLETERQNEIQRNSQESKKRLLWPAWVYCTRYYKFFI